MTDCAHDHHHDVAGSGSKGSNALLAAFAIIVTFMVVEIIGGLISGSLALLADAAHMFTDAFALGLASIAHVIARRPATATMHFGYSRAQVLAAFANGVLLCALIFWIVIEAMQRLFDPVDVSWRPMLAIAVAGLAANAAAFFILHGVPDRNVNVRGAMLHVVSDLLGSVVAIIAAVVIWAGGPMRIDAVLSLVVAALILRSAVKLLRETSHILLEGAPENISVPAMVDALKAATPDIIDIHDVRIWQVEPDEARLTLHARVRDPDAGPAALDRIKVFLEDRYGIKQSTVQIEVGPACPDCEPIKTSEIVELPKSRKPPTSTSRHGDHHHHGEHAGSTTGPALAGR